MNFEQLNKILALGLQAVATYRTMRDKMAADGQDMAGAVSDLELIHLMGGEAKALEDHAAAVLAKHGGAEPAKLG